MYRRVARAIKNMPRRRVRDEHVRVIRNQIPFSAKLIVGKVVRPALKRWNLRSTVKPDTLDIDV